MKDANFMTPDELRALADKKEAEDVIAKTGELKHDLYCFDEHDITFKLHEMDWMITKEEFDSFLDYVSKSTPMELKKGTPFVCFMEDGEESWYDDVNYGIEGVGSDWAEKHLINIKPSSSNG